MKTTLVLLFTFLILKCTYAKETILSIDLNGFSSEETITLPKGSYKLQFEGSLDCENHSINFKFMINHKIEEQFEFPSPESNNSLETIVPKTPTSCSFPDQKFEMKNRTKVELILTIKDSNDSLIKTIKRTYTALKTRKWVSSFGVSSIILLENDTYTSIEEGEGFKIIKDGSQDIFQAIP